MASDFSIRVIDSDDENDTNLLRVLAEQLHVYHRLATHGEFQQLSVMLNNDVEEIKGGILAYTHGIWLDIEFVWVADSYRRNKHGSQMLNAVELKAQSRGCKRVYLDTGASTAKSFFEACGYTICGEIPCYKDEDSRYWMYKEFV